ncbi:MAG: hypothetical protein K2W96_10615, partial [Gemmataceae bacterium]|nr:hypothetical protein [Gemmataceae bacterium]
MNRFARLVQATYALAVACAAVLLTTPSESWGQKYRGNFPGRLLGGQKTFFGPPPGLSAAQNNGGNNGGQNNGGNFNGGGGGNFNGGG